MKNRTHSPRNRSTASRAKRSLLVSTGSLLLAGNLFADTVSWNSTTGGSFNTNTAAGWNATPLFDFTTIANLSQDFAAAQTWLLDGSKTVNQLNYNDTGASGDVNGTLNAGTGAGTLTFAGTTPTANIASATFTIGANVNLSSGLTKTGAGNLALIGTVSGYTTTTANLNAVTAGTLTFGSGSNVKYDWSDKASGAGTVTFNAGATTAIMPSTVTVAAGKINVVANQLFSVASGDFTKAGNGILSLGNGNGSNLTAANVNVTGTAGGLLLNFAPAGVTGTYNVSNGAAIGFGAASGGTQDTLGNGTAGTGIYTITNDLSLSGNGSTLNNNVTGALQSLNNARYNFGGKVTITGATTVSSFSVFTFSVFDGQVTGTGDLTFKGGGGGILHNAHFILNNAANNWTGSTKVLADFGANTLLKTGATNVLPSTTTVILDANNSTAAANRGPNKTGFTVGANAPLLELQDTTQTVTALQTTAVGADRKVVWGGLTTATGGVERGGTLNLTGTGASISVGALTNSALLLKNVTVNQTGAGSTAAIGAGTTLELVGSSLGVSTTLETKGVTGAGTLILAGGWNGTVANAGSSTLKVGANPAASWITSATGFKLFGAATTNFIDTNGNNATVDAAIFDFAGQAGGFTKSGTGTLTLTNANTYTGGTTVSAGTLQLGNGGTTGKLATTGAIVNNGNLTINRSNAVVQGTDFSAAAITGTGSFTQAGAGTTTLKAANTYAGATTVNKGTLDLGGATANGSLASTSLNLGGGTLAYTRTGNTTQSFDTTNITAGASTVTAVAGNTLNLGSLSRSVGGGTVKIGTTGGTITTSTANSNGILGGYATFGDTTWAVANGSSAITGLDTYTADTWANTANIDVLTATTTQTGGSTANSLRFNRLGTSTINLSGTNTITSGGILVTSAVTNANVHITGGTLQVGAGNDLVYINNNVAFGFINSNIIDNGAGAGLTVFGTGGLTLTGTNTYTGTTTINTGGKLQLGNAATVGGPTGSLAGAGTIVNNGQLSIFRSNAVVQGTDFGAITGTGSFTQAGAGTTTLNVANTYSGGTSVSKGTLQLNNAAGAGTGTITLNGTTGATLRTGADITVANAITIAPTASSILTISSGTFNSTFSGGISNNTAFTTKLVLETSNVLTLTGTISGNRPIEKTGTGTLVTAATGTFTGGLTITEGAFQINGGTFSGNNAITLAGGAILRNSTTAAYTFGTLDLSGIGAGTINFGNAADTSKFVFANSSSMDWSGNTLSITGSFFSGSSLRFGNSNSGLNSTQLGLINIAGFNTFGLDANGFLTASAIPEPSTYAALVGLGILGLAVTRRRSRSS